MGLNFTSWSLYSLDSNLGGLISWHECGGEKAVRNRTQDIAFQIHWLRGLSWFVQHRNSQTLPLVCTSPRIRQKANNWTILARLPIVTTQVHPTDCHFDRAATTYRPVTWRRQIPGSTSSPRSITWTVCHRKVHQSVNWNRKRLSSADNLVQLVKAALTLFGLICACAKVRTAQVRTCTALLARLNG